MCTTLPEVLVTVMGIEKVLPEWRDLEVFLQLLPRSSTGERMNPYTSLWTGVRDGDGPREFHLVLLDNGRTDVLADEVGRQALHCIRCSACLNVCPVYSRTGGHAYESVYPGPIGAILTPQLRGLDQAPTLPWASIAVRRLLRGLPGQDRHPVGAVHLRGARRARGAVALASPSGGDGRGRAACSARAGATRRRSGSRGSAAGRWRGCRVAAGGWTAMRELPEVPRADLPRLVVACSDERAAEVLGRIRVGARRARRRCPTCRAPTDARRGARPARRRRTCSASGWPTTARPCTASRADGARGRAGRGGRAARARAAWRTTRRRWRSTASSSCATTRRSRSRDLDGARRRADRLRARRSPRPARSCSTARAARAGAR